MNPWELGSMSGDLVEFFLQDEAWKVLLNLCLNVELIELGTQETPSILIEKRELAYKFKAHLFLRQLKTSFAFGTRKDSLLKNLIIARQND